MARPERNNVDYFPHPVKHGKKMSYMEKKYGNDGYAVWFKILEELGDADYHYLDLSNDIQMMFLSDRCNVDEIRLKNIIDDLVKMGEFVNHLWDNNMVLFSEKFNESITDAYNRRNNKCIHLNSLCIHLRSLGKNIQDETSEKEYKKPQTKVKETKVKETIEEYTPDFLKIKDEFLNSSFWIIQTAKHKQTTEDITRENMDHFIEKLWLQDDYHKGIKEIRQHFINWFSPKTQTNDAIKDW